eukprot:6156337-Pleurochrysis_carterae.AAC.1
MARARSRSGAGGLRYFVCAVHPPLALRDAGEGLAAAEKVGEEVGVQERGHAGEGVGHVEEQEEHRAEKRGA